MKTTTAFDACSAAARCHTTHRLLPLLLLGAATALPGGCDLRMAMRRTLRVGANWGSPLEDLGVVPDHRYYLTRRDVLGNNEDLIAYAAGLLR